MPVFSPGTLSDNYKVAFGQHTTVAASDTVATGLNHVVFAVANLETTPADASSWATAHIGNQSGTPAAGAILIKSWMITSDADSTPKVATAFSTLVNWVAIGY